MFTKILVANRGEIACRILRTAQQLGIQTVAIYSDVDRQALHVQQADEAYYLGEAPLASSYLNIKKIIAIAKKTQATALHPGYGFLAENADFAIACEKAGVTFIGPRPETLATMGDKQQAKTLADTIGIPTLPGYHGNGQDLNTFQQAAIAVGYPILLKASAGGGGKGMRLVYTDSELSEALQSAQREAQANFAKDTIILEKYLAPARHIEIQIIADTQGNVVCLADRDCSIQRRHQKIIEEAPAAQLKLSTRTALQNAATTLVKKIHYLNAGTLEFLVDADERFYFMEMNTRLQVEHTVTEMITGIDLVEWQIRVSANESLPDPLQEIHPQGHAIEARLCAEDPFADFMPSTGIITHLHFPATHAALRIDTALTAGETITPYYDSLLAKIIVHANTRPLAIEALKTALTEIHIVGVTTNIPLLMNICQEKNFRDNPTSTQFIDQQPKLLETTPVPLVLIAIAAYATIKHIKASAQTAAQHSQDPNSPWFYRDLWQLNTPRALIFRWWSDHHYYKIKALSETQVLIDNQSYTVEFMTESGLTLHAKVNNEAVTATLINEHTTTHIFSAGNHFQLRTTDNCQNNQSSDHDTTPLRAPMPGTIIKIWVTPQQQVQAGDPLITLSAMKIEHQILASQEGIVKKIHYQPGDFVTENLDLIELETKC